MGLEFIWDLEFEIWNLPPLRTRFGSIKSGNPRGIKEKSAKGEKRKIFEPGNPEAGIRGEKVL
jgi:hypothetical protein